MSNTSLTWDSHDGNEALYLDRTRMLYMDVFFHGYLPRLLVALRGE